MGLPAAHGRPGRRRELARYPAHDTSTREIAAPAAAGSGGIAKGYAVDLAVQRLQAARIEEIVVNAGGDLRVAGARTQCVQLRHPRALTPRCAPRELRDAALATSAAYYSRRRYAGREVSALVDPYTRAPYVGGDSISVHAQDCMSADALTKLVLFASPALAQRALEDFDAHAIVLRQHTALA